jgi:hypothetical protein
MDALAYVAVPVGWDQGGGIHGGAIEPNMGSSLADVLLCTFVSTNAGFSPFPVKKFLA